MKAAPFSSSVHVVVTVLQVLDHLGVDLVLVEAVDQLSLRADRAEFPGCCLLSMSVEIGDPEAEPWVGEEVDEEEEVEGLQAALKRGGVPHDGCHARLFLGPM